MKHRRPEPIFEQSEAPRGREANEHAQEWVRTMIHDVRREPHYQRGYFGHDVMAWRQRARLAARKRWSEWEAQDPRRELEKHYHCTCEHTWRFYDPEIGSPTHKPYCPRFVPAEEAA